MTAKLAGFLKILALQHRRTERHSNNNVEIDRSVARARKGDDSKSLTTVATDTIQPETPEEGFIARKHKTRHCSSIVCRSN